jgi:hypothetical protein
VGGGPPVRQRALWRHEWVPRNMAAALQKAHGSREQARRLLDAARERRLARAHARAEHGDDWHPLHRTGNPRAGKSSGRGALAEFSDDQLADALGQADDAAAAGILAELDRRDRAQRKREAAAARREAQRRARDAAREARFDQLLTDGADPQAAYAEAYGVTEAKVRRDQAAEHLRGHGYAGKTFRAMVKTAHAEHVRQAYLMAEDACRGHVLNAAGERAGVDPESLFSGPVSRARKYASPELLDYFRDYGRLTVADFTASLLGGQAKFRTAGDDWA